MKVLKMKGTFSKLEPTACLDLYFRSAARGPIGNVLR